MLAARKLPVQVLDCAHETLRCRQTLRQCPFLIVARGQQLRVVRQRANWLSLDWSDIGTETDLVDLLGRCAEGLCGVLCYGTVQDLIQLSVFLPEAIGHL